jgi:hypothetical protein
MRRRLPVASLAMVAALAIVVGTAGCTASPSPLPPPAPTPTGTATADLALEVDALAHPLACQDTSVLYDDILHHATMRAERCYRGLTTVVMVAAFASSDGMRIALADQQVGGDTRWLVTGPNWYAIGPLVDVETVAAAATDASAPRGDQPPAPTPGESTLDRCATIVGNEFVSYFTDRSTFEQNRVGYDQSLPGSGTFVAGLAESDAAAQLRRLSPTDRRFDSQISTFGPPLKSFCETAFGPG